MNKYEIMYNYMLKRNVKSLNDISDKWTKAKLNFISNGDCAYGAFWWHEELVSEIKIYISYLGFIDGLVMREKEEIKWYDEFEDIKNKDEHLKKHNYYLEQRNKLVKIIESQTTIAEPVRFEFLTEVLATVPAFDKFDLVYQEIKRKGEGYDRLQLEFINSYNTGFAQCGYINYERLAEKFEGYYKEIINHKKYNEIKVEKAKLKNQTKSAKI